MKGKNILLILKVSFLLTLFGSATFYFQYAGKPKRSILISSTSQKSQESQKDPNSVPLSEEETENEKSSGEEEQQDDDRALHYQIILTEENLTSSVILSQVHPLDFKEIHFEIVTPPPQV